MIECTACRDPFWQILLYDSAGALAATKLAINRGADAGGFRDALQAGLDVVALFYAATPEAGSSRRSEAETPSRRR